MSKRSDKQTDHKAAKQAAQADTRKRPSTAGQKPADETIKETFESIVIAFVLAFVFRAYVVEAFVIPTGSMAPTLLGAHASVTCKQCGYSFTADGRTLPNSLVCPMCRYPNPLLARRARAGDRILVQKYIYNAISEPRRWDLVVFKAPHEPQTNFIKRLVGLPNESLMLFEGNVYVKANGDTWHVARKTDRPKVQRAVWQPIYHSDYIPRDGGDNRWRVPWVADAQTPTARQWQIDGRRSYLYETDEPGRIVFDFARGRQDSLKSLYPYNQNAPELKRYTENVEDVRVAATFQPDNPGLSIKLSTTARLDDPKSEAELLAANIDQTGVVSITATDPATNKIRVLATAGQGHPLAPGRNTVVELWYVDQQASVWIDGHCVVQWEYEIPDREKLRRRPKQARTPQIAIEVAGSGVLLHRVKVDRDLYYNTLFNHNTGEPALGGMYRDVRAQARELNLQADEFFCMGDNSPRSSDGRYWNGVDSWVKYRMFGDRERPGIVPRKLMMGRAFFVYYPAMFPFKEGSPHLVPNFGQMRFIH